MLLQVEQHFSQDERIEMMSISQGDIDMHRHEFLEMAYIKNGRAIHTLSDAQTQNDTQTLVEKGDYFIINYGAEHKFTLINQERFDIINILFKPELIDKSLKNCHRFLDLINHYLIRINTASLEKNPTDVIYHDKDQTIYNLVAQMETEYTRKEPGYVEILRCHLIEIIVRTMRTISKKESVVPGSQTDSSSYILDYIDKNYMNAISLSDICSGLLFSLPYLCRKFKKDTGFTFISYLQRKRMEQSGRLIANTDKKISEISELVGYQDIKFFNRVFKKHWGMTPGKFRKLYHSDQII